MVDTRLSREKNVAPCLVKIQYFGVETGMTTRERRPGVVYENRELPRLDARMGKTIRHRNTHQK